MDSCSQTEVNLRVLSRLEVGDKLDCSGLELRIVPEPSSAFWKMINTLRRTFGMNSRETLLMKLQFTVRDAEHYIKESRDDRVSKQMQKIIPGAMSGIDNLMETYSRDTYMISALEVLHNRCRDLKPEEDE